MKAIAFFVLMLFAAKAQAQRSQDHFPLLVATATGDLNKDGIPDKAVVMQDTAADKAPYRLQVFIGKPDGRQEELLHCTECIDPRYPNGRDGWATGNDLDTIEIVNGLLFIKVELLRGSYVHKFRYQGNKMVLIGYSQTSSDGNGSISSVDFNLSTGKRDYQVENYETNALISKGTTKVMIRPLPDLKTFRPHANEAY